MDGEVEKQQQQRPPEIERRLEFSSSEESGGEEWPPCDGEHGQDVYRAFSAETMSTVRLSIAEALSSPWW
jgi:hypothetical protein